MKKIFGLFSASFLFYCFVLIATPVTISSCEKEIIHDTVIIRDTVTIIDSSCSACYDLKDGLVAWYNFNGSTLKDSSGKNNHIVFNNAVPTTDRFGKPNNAYLFNGNSSYMRVNHNASLNPTQPKMSMMAIVKLNGFYTGVCHSNDIFKKGFDDYTNGTYGLRISPVQECHEVTDITKERVWAYFGNGQLNAVGAMDTVAAVNTGIWYNIIFVYDGAKTELYVNGVLKDTRTGTGGYTPNAHDLYIGKTENPPYPYWFNGVIDEIRIYNRPLCLGEVKLLNKLPN